MSAASRQTISLLAALGFLVGAQTSRAQTGACNGSEALCDRAYDQVFYAMTHNAHSNTDDGFFWPLFANQVGSLSVQLSDGIRALMLDTHYQENQPGTWLCHGVCILGQQRPLVDGLTEIREFLDANPGEVVTLQFESYISEADTETAFVDSGLASYTYAHNAGVGWPTLGDMITSGQRLVVFTSDSNATLPWYHYSYDLLWETKYSFAQPSELDCQEDRGSPSNDLFLINHFITGGLGPIHPVWAIPVNSWETLFRRAAACWGFEPTNPSRHPPNFIAVDWYFVGDVVDVVNELNRTWPSPPMWLDVAPLVPGDTARLTVSGAEPGSMIGFLASTGPGTTCASSDPNYCLDLQSPLIPVGWSVADAGGIATFDADVPVGSIPGTAYTVQAYVHAAIPAFNKSIIVTQTITAPTTP